jgi:hypothetical protein
MQVKGYKKIIIARVFDWSEIATECILTNEISLWYKQTFDVSC